MCVFVTNGLVLLISERVYIYLYKENLALELRSRRFHQSKHHHQETYRQHLSQYYQQLLSQRHIYQQQMAVNVMFKQLTHIRSNQ